MKKINCDILIVGAGLTGLISAYSLSDLELNIILIDKFDFLSKKNNYQDLRTTAISEGSKNFLNKIKIWQQISNFAEPIKQIKVIDRSPNRLIDFYNKHKNQNLGYIIRNTDIKKKVLDLISRKKNIRLISNQSLQTISYNNNLINCDFKNIKTSITIEAKLLIAADGKNSKIRNLLKTPVYTKKYNQKALVVNFHHNLNHHSTAYELFYNSGPFAILPMKKIKKNEFTSSLIWTHNSQYIDSLFKVDRQFLKLILEEKIKKYVGSVKEIIDVQKFDLSAHINSNFYEKNTLYLGDAAHSIHPIAGQGWNIGVRDIQKCLDILKKNIHLGLDFSSPHLFKEYNNKTYNDSYILFQITDKLNKIFLNDSYAINYLRKKGFDIIHKEKIIKNYITNFAMGLN